MMYKQYTNEKADVRARVMHKWRASRRGNETRACCREEGSDEEVDNMVCQMTGQQWEQLPFPIIIDPGACTSVMPTSWCPHVPTEETSESRSGEIFRAANGQNIFNEGRKTASFMTKGGVRRDMHFTSCEVSKALGSVSHICQEGRRVVFSPPWSEEGPYIKHCDIGE